MQLCDSYGSFDTHIAMVYDILCHMTYVIKCHKMAMRGVYMTENLAQTFRIS